MKWEDALRRFASEEEMGRSWMVAATEKAQWSSQADYFAKWCAGLE